MKLCREGGLKNWPFSVVLGESHHFASQTTNRHKKHMQELDLGSEKCVMIKIYYSNGLFFSFILPQNCFIFEFPRA